jgi:cytochrome c oxidase assembly protein subunit 15
MHQEQPFQEAPRWLHYCALLTAGAACVLLMLGAEVTTKGVGMVDQRGLRSPLHLVTVLAEGSPLERGLGYLIEHSHRFMGWLVGAAIIVLAVGLWLKERRSWVRWLGLVALAGVCAQGTLGILRVNENELMGNDLALVHGCFAHLVLAALVSLALVTSRSWQRAEPGRGHENLRLRRWSLLTAGLVYAQLVLGAILRHKDLVLAARGHLLLAFAAVAVVAWLLKEVFEDAQRSRPELMAGLALGLLVVVQLSLGVEAWLSKFSPRPRSWEQFPELLRSAHYLVGSLVFSATVVVALQAHRRLAWQAHPAAAPARRLEGAA